MKKNIIKALLLAIIAAICILPQKSVSADDTETISVCFHYEQEDARKMLDMINNFRASAGSDEDDNTYPLIYDYELEKVAMQRAAEIAVKFSDNRPDGSSYLTALSDYGFNTSPRGGFYAESILFGTEDSMQLNEAFTLMCDTTVDRVNMLGYYNAVGVGHIRTADKTDFWVQIFSNKTKNDIYTAPINADVYVNMKVPQSIVGSVSVSYSSGSQTVGVGETVTVPYYIPSVKFSGSELTKPVTLAPLVFESDDGYVKSSGGKMTGLKAGSGSLSAQLFGKTYTYNVTVTTGSSTPVPTPSPIPVLTPTSEDVLNANKPTNAPTQTPTQEPEQNTELKTGDTFSELGLKYKITASGKVEFIGLVVEKTKSITIPDTVNHLGKTYKIVKIGAKAFYKNTNISTIIVGKNITTIGKQAFYGCSKLTAISFNAKSLKKVGSKAFTKINSKAGIRVPKACEAKYKKLLKKGGLNKKIVIVTF